MLDGEGRSSLPTVSEVRENAGSFPARRLDHPIKNAPATSFSVGPS